MKLRTILLLVMTGHPAGAADVSISGFFSQRLGASLENGDGSNGSEGFDAATNLGFTIVSRTPVSQLVLSPGVRLGLSSDENFDPSQITPRFEGSYSFTGDQTTVQITASAVPELTRFSDFEEGDFVEQNALLLTTRVGLNVNRTFNPQNSGRLGFNFRARDFLDGGDNLTETRSYQVSTGWRRGLDPITGSSINLSVQRFESDDNTDRMTYSPTLGFDRQLTPSLSFDSNVGVSLTDRTSGDGSSEQQTTFTGSAFVTGDLPNGGYRIGVRQAVEQNIDGELDDTTSIVAQFNQQLTNDISFSMGSRLALQQGLFLGSNDLDLSASLSPSLSIALAENWRGQVGYVLRARDRDSGDRTVSHAVFFQISRALSVLP